MESQMPTSPNSQILRIGPGDRSQTYDAARAAVAAGLSIVPIMPDGTKRPAWYVLPQCSWKTFTQRRPTAAELQAWFVNQSLEDPPLGFAVVGGEISGGLEVIDFDTIELFGPWAERVERHCPGLVAALVRVRTPRPGLHVYFRSSMCGGNKKLAQREIFDVETESAKVKTLIEAKGEGGYIIAPGSPPSCHPSGRPYLFLDSRDFSDVPTITPEERVLLLATAMDLTEIVRAPPTARPPHRESAPRSNRPGDRFMAATSWPEILEPHGWTYVGTAADGVEAWRRPGKMMGQSATINYGGLDLLHVFSENAPPFEGSQSYTKLAAFCLLQFGGDFRAAIAELIRRGFGGRSHRGSHYGRHRFRRRRPRR